jgi:hypothetical protein
MYQPFKTKAVIGEMGYPSNITIHVGSQMLPTGISQSMYINTGYTAFHITKAQAMEFFGLVDPSTGIQHGDTIKVCVEHHVASPAAVVWDILYLDHEYTTMVKHAQCEAKDRAGAIAAFREHTYGASAYIISVTKHETDMNAGDF